MLARSIRSARPEDGSLHSSPLTGLSDANDLD